MIISEAHNNAIYQIQSFSKGKVVVNGKTYTSSLIISPDRVLEKWNPQDVTSITDSDLLQLLDCNPSIILLGTGERSVILPAKQLTSLLDRQFHIECMNTAAAIRTYTVLISEGRNVVAGLIL